MLVEHILPQARTRLMIMDVSASLAEAVALLTQPNAEFIIVCDNGIVAGVITRSDIVAQSGERSHDASAMLVRAIMTPNVLSCTVSDSLPVVLRMMKTRGIRHIPVVDDASKPIGVIYADDALEDLLEEAETEDALLRDYIAGVGYR